MYSRWKQLVGDPLMPKEWPKRARIGINGCGPIARTLIRCALRDARGLDIVAINEPNMTPEEMVYLLKYDSNRGPFQGYISDKIVVTPAKDGENQEYCNIEISGRFIAVFHFKNIEEIPWHWLNVEYVLETSGTVKHLKEATKHLLGGRARKVLVVDDTLDIPLLMYPISCRGYQRGSSVMASGSAMAHAIATLVSLAEESCKFEQCVVTVVSSVGANQNLVDSPTKDPLSWRKGRGAMQSIIPGICPNVVDTVVQALPCLRGRIDAITLNVPTIEGAVIDLVFRTNEPIDNINEVIDRLTRCPLLEKYNELHIQTQPFNNRPLCGGEMPMVSLQNNSPSNSSQNNSDQSLSSSSGPDKAEYVPVISMPIDLTSIVVPLKKEEAYVSSDAIGKHSLCLLNVDYCFSVSTGRMVKLIAWFDSGLSYCERILDTIVYMRSIDHN